MQLRIVARMEHGFYANTGGVLLVEGIDYRVAGNNAVVLYSHGSRCYPGVARAARRVRRELRSGRIPSCESRESYMLAGGGYCPLLVFHPRVVPEPLEVSHMLQLSLYYERLYERKTSLERVVRPYLVGSCSLVASHWWRILRDEGIGAILVRLDRVERAEPIVAPVVSVSRRGASLSRFRCHLGASSFKAEYVAHVPLDVHDLLEALRIFSRAQVEAGKAIQEELGVKLARPALDSPVVKMGALAWPLNSVVVVAYYNGLIGRALFEKLMETRKRCGFGGWPPSGVYAALVEPLGLVDAGWVSIEIRSSS